MCAQHVHVTPSRLGQSGALLNTSHKYKSAESLPAYNCSHRDIAHCVNNWMINNYIILVGIYSFLATSSEYKNVNKLYRALYLYIIEYIFDPRLVLQDLILFCLYVESTLSTESFSYWLLLCIKYTPIYCSYSYMCLARESTLLLLLTLTLKNGWYCHLILLR